jgi:hypothetical protein
MIVVTVFRPDLSSDAVAAALRHGLGPGYRVSEGATSDWLDRVVPAGPEAMLVARNHVLRANVRLVHHADRCALQIRAGGMFWYRLISRVGICRAVARALVAAEFPAS